MLSFFCTFLIQCLYMPAFLYLQPLPACVREDVTFLAQDVSHEGEASVPAGLDSAQPAPASPQAAKDGVYHPPHAIMFEVPDFLKAQPLRKPASVAAASDGNASDCGSSGGDSSGAPAPIRVGRVYKAEASASWRQDKEFVKVENKHAHGHAAPASHGHAAPAGHGHGHAPAPKAPLPASGSSPAAMTPPEASVQPAKPRRLAKAMPLANPFCLLNLAADDMDDAEVAEPAFV